jgi:hypothetical protein
VGVGHLDRLMDALARSILRRRVRSFTRMMT